MSILQFTLFDFFYTQSISLNCSNEFLFSSKYVLKLQENTKYAADTVNSLILINILLGIIFILSEFGEMVNNEFAAFDGKLCQCVWYNFPNQTQQIFGAFMMYSQDLVIIQGFGNARCTRDTFKRVSFNASN